MVLPLCKNSSEHLDSKKSTFDLCVVGLVGLIGPRNADTCAITCASFRLLTLPRALENCEPSKAIPRCSQLTIMSGGNTRKNKWRPRPGNSYCFRYNGMERMRNARMKILTLVPGSPRLRIQIRPKRSRNHQGGILTGRASRKYLTRSPTPDPKMVGLYIGKML